MPSGTEAVKGTFLYFPVLPPQPTDLWVVQSSSPQDAFSWHSLSLGMSSGLIQHLFYTALPININIFPSALRVMQFSMAMCYHTVILS